MRQKLSQGTTLIENLIAMFITAMGLLGIAGLHASELSMTHNAFNQTTATIAANDIVERMRANLDGFSSNHYTFTPAQSIPALPSCADGNCTAEQTATRDLHDWATYVSTHLPSGKASLSCADTNPATTPIELGSLCEVTIMWNERRKDTTGTKISATKTDCTEDADQLRCVYMQFSP